VAVFLIRNTIASRSRDDKSKISEEEGFVVEVQIASAPTARYYRTVTQTKLDLIGRVFEIPPP